MRTFVCIFFLVFLSSISLAQDTYQSEILGFQEELNKEYADPVHSPLAAKDLKRFKGLEFFPIDKRYRVKAKFIRFDAPKTIMIATTTGEARKYDIYAEVHFELEGKQLVLEVYQSHRLRAIPLYRNYLFIPFKDQSSNQESYGGGRYLDLEIPKEDEIILDFNKAYNPYCAYNSKYSCPIPPSKNYLEIKVLAGVKKFAK